MISWVAALLMTCSLFAQEGVESRIQTLRDRQATNVLVVAHRGDWRHAPENSLQAFQNCIDMGVDMIELDLKKTRDGHLIVMHDQTIDRTTDGRGVPADYTLEELRRFHLKNGLGRTTSHVIPTLEEVLRLAQGKILINIDKGYEYFKEVYALLLQTHTADQVVIKSNHPYERVKAENGEVLEKVIYMPIVHLDKPGAAERIEGYKAMRPVAIECCFETVTPEVLSLLKKVKANGSKIWLNSLWPSLNGGHDDDRAVEQKQPDESWGWLLEQGASLIQSDRVAELMVYLQKKHRR